MLGCPAMLCAGDGGPSMLLAWRFLALAALSCGWGRRLPAPSDNGWRTHARTYSALELSQPAGGTEARCMWPAATGPPGCMQLHAGAPRYMRTLCCAGRG